MRDRFVPFSWLRTIRSRLYLAFGLTAAMTVIGSLFALLSSANIGATLTEIVFRSTPATVESIRLSEDTSDLVAFAPRLMAVDDDGHRAEVAGEIANQSRSLKARIDRLQAFDAGQDNEIEVAEATMDEQLAVLNRTVAARIEIANRRRELTRAVRKSHEALLEKITPAIDDANFDLMTKSQASESKAELDQSIDSLRRLLEIQADANLLAGLLIECVDGGRRYQPATD